MNVIYLTSGLTGAGRLVRGISIGNAIQRRALPWKYTIVSNSIFGRLADLSGISHIEIPKEHEYQLNKENYHTSVLCKILASLAPDVLIVDLVWFLLHHFIRELPYKKIFITHVVHDNFFYVLLPEGTIYFRPEDYDRALAIEPFRTSMPFDEINPIIVRNRDEIYSIDNALATLNLNAQSPKCLVTFNFHPTDPIMNMDKYSYLKKEGYEFIYTKDYPDGLFPAVDYYNAFDIVISAAGYSQFWEARFFNKKAFFEKRQTVFEDVDYRLKKCKKHSFTENGADQLVDIIEKL